MSSSQMRLNRATGEWVIYAPSRRKRPHDFPTKKPVENISPKDLETCPFCPGNENVLQSRILEFPSSCEGEWQTRVISNKYPALTTQNSTQRVAHGIYLTTAGYGRQEVIIESPHHAQTLATLSVEQVEILIETYHQRYLAFMEDPEIMMVIR